MRFYVATKFENLNEARLFMEALKYWGHEITHDWTVHETEDGHSRREHAVLDIDGVIKADALVLVWYPDMRGAFVEMGVALGLNKSVYLIGWPRDDTIFYDHPLVIRCGDQREFFSEYRQKVAAKA